MMIKTLQEVYCDMMFAQFAEALKYNNGIRKINATVRACMFSSDRHSFHCSDVITLQDIDEDSAQVLCEAVAVNPSLQHLTISVLCAPRCANSDELRLWF